MPGEIFYIMDGQSERDSEMMGQYTDLRSSMYTMAGQELNLTFETLQKGKKGKSLICETKIKSIFPNIFNLLSLVE